MLQVDGSLHGFQVFPEHPIYIWGRSLVNKRQWVKTRVCRQTQPSRCPSSYLFMISAKVCRGILRMSKWTRLETLPQVGPCLIWPRNDLIFRPLPNWSKGLKGFLKQIQLNGLRNSPMDGNPVLSGRVSKCAQMKAFSNPLQTFALVQRPKDQPARWRHWGGPYVCAPDPVFTHCGFRWMQFAVFWKYTRSGRAVVYFLLHTYHWVKVCWVYREGVNLLSLLFAGILLWIDGLHGISSPR